MNNMMIKFSEIISWFLFGENNNINKNSVIIIDKLKWYDDKMKQERDAFKEIIGYKD